MIRSRTCSMKDGIEVVKISDMEEGGFRKG